MASYRYGSISPATDQVRTLTSLRFCEGPLNLGWKHCTMTSGFISELAAMPYRSSASSYRQVRHDVSYLCNELIENTVKFRAPGDVQLDVLVAAGTITIIIANAIDRVTATGFRNVLEQLNSDEPEVLLLERIEQNAAQEANKSSGLGLLTLMSDYGAKFEWSFVEQSDGYDRLTTVAAIPMPIQ